MGDFSAMSYPFFTDPPMYMQQQRPDELIVLAPKPNDPPPPPPVVICPSEVDHINITLEKNQQCQCKDCGKLFNSVWYLKQHAVKHSNDRPFKCKYCFKTYKFRSNLYQHKCPDRQKHMGQGNAKRLETNQLLKSRIEANLSADDLAAYHAGAISDNEENDIPITYGLLIHKFDESLIPKQEPPTPQVKPVEEPQTTKQMNCVRDQQLPEHEIETYITENKNRLHTCRKCRLLFPTEASLMRHSAAHSREDMFPYKCSNCRQAFETEKELRRHSHMHVIMGPWKCENCSGVFRSSKTLRRHRDQNRACNVPQEQSDIMVSVHSPIDPFSFIPSESDLFAPDIKKSPDSGVGSSPDHRITPDRTHLLEVDPFELYGKKKEKEDDEDSGFRSRLNSVTQSSPGSSVFSCEGTSPRRKHSEDPGGIFAEGFGTGPNFGQHLFGDFSRTDFPENLLLDHNHSTIWGH